MYYSPALGRVCYRPNDFRDALLLFDLVFIPLALATFKCQWVHTPSFILALSGLVHNLDDAGLRLLEISNLFSQFNP